VSSNPTNPCSCTRTKRESFLTASQVVILDIALAPALNTGPCVSGVLSTSSQIWSTGKVCGLYCSVRPKALERTQHRKWCSAYLARAIQKYGSASFSVTTIYCGLDLTHTLHVMEKVFIRAFNSHIKEGTISAETRSKLREANVGKRASEETRLKMSVSRKGKSMSETARANMHTALCKRRRYEIITPSGEIVFTHSLRAFASANGLTQSGLSRTASGHQASYRGHFVRRVFPD
jgi:hypothetical protein